MISIDEAYSWLEQVPKPPLSTEMNLNLYELHNKYIPEELRDRLASDLRITSLQISNNVERLHVLTSIGKYHLSKGDFEAAESVFQDALRDFSEGSHEVAVAKWLLGIAQWNVGRNSAAHANWTRARMAFGECQNFWRNRQDPATRNADALKNLWYSDVLKKIRVEMACTVEEADAWLTRFEPSPLSASARKLAMRIRTDIHKRKFVTVYEFSNLLIGVTRTSTNPAESAEAWEIIGLAACQTGNFADAILYLKRALSAFDPFSHQGATVKWMIGIAQWALPGEHGNAIASWQDAIEKFDYNRLMADRANNKEKRDWYTGLIETLNDALAMKQAEKLGM